VKNANSGKDELVEYRGKEIKQTYDRRFAWETHHQILSQKLAFEDNSNDHTANDNLFMVIGDSNLLFNDHGIDVVDDIETRF